MAPEIRALYNALKPLETEIGLTIVPGSRYAEAHRTEIRLPAVIVDFKAPVHLPVERGQAHVADSFYLGTYVEAKTDDNFTHYEDLDTNVNAVFDKLKSTYRRSIRLVEPDTLEVDFGGRAAIGYVAIIEIPK